jgi:phosphoribosylanthranilate isomerase
MDGVPVRVKICGVRRLADAAAAVAAGADFLGLNFHPPSPRYLEPEAAVDLAAALPGVALVGVFVDLPRAEVERIAARVGLAALQFSGEEDPAYCAGWPWRTVKTIRLAPGLDASTLAARYATDYLMADSFVPGLAGGTGVALDPALTIGLPRERLFVAGGLRPETVAEVVRRVRPYAVDVASGVESRPGEKDHAKLQDFIRRAKAA